MGQTSSQHQEPANMSQRNRIIFGPSRSPSPESDDSDMAQRSRIVIGPSMSPTPESEDNREAAQVSTAAAAPPVENEVEQPSHDEQPSKKKKKRKKTKEKHSKSLDSDTLVEEVTAHEAPKKHKKKRRKSLDSEAASQEASVAGDEDASAHDSTKKSKKKKKSRKTHPEPEEANAVTDDISPAPWTGDVEEQQQASPKRRKKRSRGLNLDKTDETEISHAQEHLVSHAIGGSPPSAQPSSVNGIQGHNPTEEHDNDDASIVPDSQQLPPQGNTDQLLEPSQIKTEPRDDDSDLGEDLRFHFTGIAASFTDAVTDPIAETRRENDPQSGLDWLHKRGSVTQETPLPTTRDTLLSTGLPGLQPSQVETEPQSNSHSDSGNATDSVPVPSNGSSSHSPSVQRLERMSRSRSRSVSRAPSRSALLGDRPVSAILQILVRSSPNFYSLNLSQMRDQTHTNKYPTAPHRVQGPIDPFQHACLALQVQARTAASTHMMTLSQALAQDPANFAIQSRPAAMTLRSTLMPWISTSSRI